MPETRKPTSGESDPLASYFAAAQAEAPDLPSELRDRIITAAILPRTASRPSPMPQPHAQWRWLSGWALQGLAGAVAAGLAGVWIGVMLPLPVVALDLPLWMHEALSYVDMIALPLIGLDDPLLMGF